MENIIYETIGSPEYEFLKTRVIDGCKDLISKVLRVLVYVRASGLADDGVPAPAGDHKRSISWEKKLIEGLSRQLLFCYNKDDFSKVITELFRFKAVRSMKPEV